MIVNAGRIKMTADSGREVTRSRKEETTMCNLRSNQMRYYASTFEEAYGSHKHSVKEETTERDKSLPLPCEGDEEHPLPVETYERLKGRQPKAARVAPASRQEQMDQIREFVIRLRIYIMTLRQRIFGNTGIFRSMKGILGYYDSILGYPAESGGHLASSNDASVLYDASSGSKAVSVWSRKDRVTETYRESASVTFETVGQIQTEDGRTIDFTMQMEMHESYEERFEATAQNVEVIMTDPLVINLSDAPIGIADRTWKFDLDADGFEDELYSLSEGAGYLVYDRDGSGTIDDGTELFGAQTGDGFAELAAFDRDRSGWIDEADAIYSKLKVWVKNDRGEDRMVGLKEAGVGAIYLGSVAAQFAYRSETEHATQAAVRSAGFYLSEDGTAHQMAQIDFATK